MASRFTVSPPPPPLRSQLSKHAPDPWSEANNRAPETARRGSQPAQTHGSASQR